MSYSNFTDFLLGTGYYNATQEAERREGQTKGEGTKVKHKGSSTLDSVVGAITGVYHPTMVKHEIPRPSGVSNGVSSSDAATNFDQTTLDATGPLVDLGWTTVQLGAPVIDATASSGSAIHHAANHIGDAVSGVFSDIANIPNEIGNAMDSGEQTVSHAFDTIKKTAQNIADDLKKPLHTLGDDLKNDLKYLAIFGGIFLVFAWKATAAPRSAVFETTKTLGKRAWENAPKLVEAAPLLL